MLHYLYTARTPTSPTLHQEMNKCFIFCSMPAIAGAWWKFSHSNRQNYQLLFLKTKFELNQRIKTGSTRASNSMLIVNKYDKSLLHNIPNHILTYFYRQTNPKVTKSIQLVVLAVRCRHAYFRF